MSSFQTDQQTLQDLSLTGINGQPAIIDLFKPITIGGQVKLKELFAKPLTDINAIRARAAAIRYFDRTDLHISLHKEEADFISFYIDQENDTAASKFKVINDRVRNWVKPTNQHYVISRGVRLLFKLIKKVELSFEKHQHDIPAPLKLLREQTEDLLKAIPVATQHLSDLSKFDIDKLDRIFRNTKVEAVRHFLNSLYTVDVFYAVGFTGRQYGFCYPEFIDTEQPELNLNGFYHPFVSKPAVNDITFDSGKNLCFITGANMAGKSTVLKSISVCVYMAQLGFPVPATAMRTSVFNGLFTTINLSDNIVAGHSHFYREVLRIKEVAQKIGTVNKLLVIFDELFRGTNVKDAYDASLEIVKAFTEVKSSAFMISTHIVEVADELRSADNIFFNCLSTDLVDGKAIYTYKLKPGISHERLGMRIIEDEGLVDMIKALSKK
ncbi:MutS-related protein [Mucilaginibacter myungsuensis]|uniref:DNA mismatch repair proteins mutS family domain-containing protein n=1 Tax=Mucilaginibacter myungsuensis TaxID=649104 RepID=A0A929L0D6_9SPHI|nr:hypothetical protein [Mucilaginibacter myungsuensis]MBE9663808.1 hypothetical protein [Mucilaginibacter myungsuensis]MDN3598477.1 hypothetical protein [Mucilaginibacter myungsuensis]